MAFPLTIVLTFLSRRFSPPKKVYRSAMTFTGVFCFDRWPECIRLTFRTLASNE
nr:hypothetical protein [Peribacillus sp. Bi96]